MTTTAGAHRKAEEKRELEEYNSKLAERHAVSPKPKPKLVANPERVKLLAEAGGLESNLPMNSAYWKLPEFVED